LKTDGKFKKDAWAFKSFGGTEKLNFFGFFFRNFSAAFATKFSYFES